VYRLGVHEDAREETRMCGIVAPLPVADQPSRVSAVVEKSEPGGGGFSIGGWWVATS
jgi:hypothetical protein